jgi:hypothetical protein
VKLHLFDHRPRKSGATVSFITGLLLRGQLRQQKPTWCLERAGERVIVRFLQQEQQHSREQANAPVPLFFFSLLFQLGLLRCREIAENIHRLFFGFFFFFVLFRIATFFSFFLYLSIVSKKYGRSPFKIDIFDTSISFWFSYGERYFSFMTRYNHFSGVARGASCEPEAKPRASSAEGTAEKKVKKN